MTAFCPPGRPVALRKESVDRNFKVVVIFAQNPPSLSARRAWIEMRSSMSCQNVTWSLSARRAWIEIGGHNYIGYSSESLSARRAWIEIKDHALSVTGSESLSARRAWIEMRLRLTVSYILAVALRKESVDRNFPGMSTILFTIGRSPQGERG